MAANVTINAPFLSSYVFSPSVPTVILDRLVRVFGNGAALIKADKLAKIYSLFSSKENRAERVNLLLALADATALHPLSRLESFVALCETGKVRDGVVGGRTGVVDHLLTADVVSKWCEENRTVSTIRFVLEATVQSGFHLIRTSPSDLIISTISDVCHLTDSDIEQETVQIMQYDNCI